MVNEVVTLSTESSDGLYEVRRKERSQPLSVREQFLGTRRLGPGQPTVYETEAGEVAVTVARGMTTVVGNDVPRVRLPLSWPVSILSLRREVEGTLGHTPICLCRPSYGMRRRDRSVHIDAGEISLATDYQRSRRYRIVRNSDKSIVLERRGSTLFLGLHISPAETALALAVEMAGVINSSSLWNYVSI